MIIRNTVLIDRGDNSTAMMCYGPLLYPSSSPVKDFVSVGHNAKFPVLYGQTETVWLLPWPAHPSELSLLEHVWPMVAKRLSHYYSPVTTVDKLWYRIEATRTAASLHAIQSPFDSMP
ncbi:hypothetical protein TNCV_387031 [Trichonephila clavipes]|nr:hypothetical protein TNCV_387031 [Trichonephila clavipes]